MLNNPYGYTGEQLDDESGLIYLRARYYDSEIGRFVNQDTYKGSYENPLSMNKYSYVENNPLNYIDPLGLSKKVPNIPIDDVIKAIYLNHQEGANNFGHAAIMLVTSDGFGVLYSYNGNADKTKQIVAGFYAEGKLLKTKLDLSQMHNFINKGTVMTYNYDGEWEPDKYNRYISINVSYNIGFLMYNKAEQLVKSPGAYNLYDHNCNHVAQTILAAGGLNWTQTYGNSNLIEFIYGTIPNEAYNLGVSEADQNGWSYGTFPMKN